ncbi:hypothetical protein DRB06_07520 [Actinomyces sp. Z5]|uniref:hypothetical protein n=1 Tax=Actinomyces sp. Z5 TaxID=2250216 RepID=UPI000DCB752F|nr:hypothetical protein [Actinomyces sp. Z5]RAX20864.1 hypothetical protein DRB06_07520 [Actinomyces sp. Z5]
MSDGGYGISSANAPTASASPAPSTQPPDLGDVGSWTSSAGHDWLILADPDPEQLLLAAYFDYGLVDEPPARLDAAARLCGALRAELQRPIEVGVGEVSVPEVAVELEPSMLGLRIRGRRAAVLGAWTHLGELFARPDLPANVPLLPRQVNAWDRDLATHAGVSAMNLADMPIHGPDGEAGRLLSCELLAHLDPRRGAVRHVFITNDPTLVGVGWTADPPAAAPPTRPPVYLDRRPALVLCPPDDGVVLSATATPGADAYVAGFVMQALIADLLDRMDMQARLGYEFITLRDAFYCCFALNTNDGRLGGREVMAVHDAVVTHPQPVPDTLIERALNAYGPSATVDDALRLRTSGRAGNVQPTADGVRRALAEIRASVHLPLRDETEPLAEQAGYLLWKHIDEPGGDVILLHDGPQHRRNADHPDAIKLTAHQIQAHQFNWVYRGLPRRWHPDHSAGFRWVDSTRLVMACYDPSDQYLELIDDRLRTVSLYWDEVVTHPQLRTELERRGIWRLPRGTFGLIQ